eukprot:m.185806 g.185806  ORF g.185806 m.185806 type:complete len:73 (-) comp14736_c0_seq2:1103-1321(-)
MLTCSTEICHFAKVSHSTSHFNPRIDVTTSIDHPQGDRDGKSRRWCCINEHNTLVKINNVGAHMLHSSIFYN